MSIRKVKSVSGVAEEVRRLQREGRKVVFTNGCFDILHSGHVALFSKARALGDALVVALNSDSSVVRLKGDGRPIFMQDERAEIVAAMRAVDLVCIFEEDTPLRAIVEIRPDVLVKGADWSRKGIVGQAEVEGWGGSVIAVDLVQGHSTTGIVERVVENLRPGPQAGTGDAAGKNDRLT